MHDAQHDRPAHRRRTFWYILGAALVNAAPGVRTRFSRVIYVLAVLLVIAAIVLAWMLSNFNPD